MHTLTAFPVVAVLLTGALLLVTLSGRAEVPRAKWLTRATALSVLPGVAMLALFYSLAIHMHWSLGAWPRSIGMRDFSAPLLIHAHIATHYFGLMILVSVLAWPLVTLRCLLVPRWRFGVHYATVYMLTCLAGFSVMLLAPPPFLNWWWD